MRGDRAAQMKCPRASHVRRDRVAQVRDLSATHTVELFHTCILCMLCCLVKSGTLK